MDLADRNLNSAAVQANFAAGKDERAEQLSRVFTIEMGVQNSLYDMQCMWYETAAGRCYMKLGKFGLALKNLRAVSKHFEDFREDQFDFHQYCIRKMTLRAYLEMLRFEDSIYSNKFFFEAATLAVECYIKLHDDPQLAETEIQSIKKMQKLKGKKGQNQKKKDSSSSSKGKKEDIDEEDETSEELGLKYLRENHLDQAVDLLVQLKKRNGDKLKTHCVAFEVHWRKQKMCLCLQALKAAKKLVGIHHPHVHKMVVKMGTQVEQWEQNKEESLVQDILAEDVKAMLGDSQDISTYNRNYLDQHCEDSLERTLAACEVMYDLDANNQEQVTQLLMNFTDKLRFDLREVCVDVHKFFLRIGCQDVSQAWKIKCAEIFCWSDYFEGEESQGVMQNSNGNVTIELGETG
eukprot:TRINITY_DN19203_c0_g1_i1.p1 TRINITY_DN19203_c0_g1~~TRINITY_DN19203_c0_g1_i1.p1  ORF type:complete len:405 (-),score=48.23 TRINITY_DN19203_c0_g1_i1:234-1448(-)